MFYVLPLHYIGLENLDTNKGDVIEGEVAMRGIEPLY